MLYDNGANYYIILLYCYHWITTVTSDNANGLSALWLSLASAAQCSTWSPAEGCASRTHYSGRSSSSMLITLSRVTPTRTVSKAAFRSDAPCVLVGSSAALYCAIAAVTSGR